MNYGWGDRQTQKNTQTDKHINTMTWAGLGAGPSEKDLTLCWCLNKHFLSFLINIDLSQKRRKKEKETFKS